MALFDDSDIEFNYKVDCIGNYADAQQYLDTTSWCISLIAVEVSPENKIVSITSRWNTCAGDTGNFITKDELKSILGMENYNKLLCELAENH